MPVWSNFRTYYFSSVERLRNFEVSTRSATRTDLTWQNTTFSNNRWFIYQWKKVIFFLNSNDHHFFFCDEFDSHTIMVLPYTAEIQSTNIISVMFLHLYINACNHIRAQSHSTTHIDHFTYTYNSLRTHTHGITHMYLWSPFFKHSTAPM